MERVNRENFEVFLDGEVSHAPSREMHFKNSRHYYLVDKQTLARGPSLVCLSSSFVFFDEMNEGIGPLWLKSKGRLDFHWCKRRIDLGCASIEQQRQSSTYMKSLIVFMVVCYFFVFTSDINYMSLPLLVLSLSMS